ncbi:type I secretion system permease/ATPase [Sulfurimonas sp. SAG-AH-194-C20]|nr:type I secretion system permease/ATPase [Sulfurimonas sp. SAG-AH-194-C20]MDF1879423.1 type I secretion system permease/ATPase [Sulfurimonas sp. SAG-AH-194-C20]
MSSPQGSELVESLHHILKFYFGEIKRETILAISGATEEEFDVKSTLKVAKESNLYAQTQEVNLESLDSFLLPIILYNEKNELIILQAMTRDKVNYVDIASGESYETPKKKLKKFKNAIMFFRNKQDSLVSSRTKEMSWFWNPIKASWRAYVEVAFISLFINIFALALPLFTMNVYNRIIPNFATDTLYVLGGGILIIFLFEVILKSVRVYILEKAGKKIAIHLEEVLLERMIGVKTQYDKLLSGTKANLFRELSQVKEFFTSRSLTQILDLPFFFIAVFVIYLISPTIAIIPFSAGIIMVIFNLLMQIPLATLAHEQFKKAQSKHGYLVETIQGRDAIKLVNGHTHRLFTWSRVVAFYEKLGEKIQLLQHLTSNTSYTIIQMVTLLVVAVGVYEIHSQSLSVGGLIAITILSSRAMVPIVNISSVLLNYKKMKDSLESINEFWHLPREVNEHTQIGLGELKGAIEFSDVSYFYQGSKYPSLDNLNIKIAAGEKVGIIGQTGAGKSTFQRLVSLLDTPTSGTVYLDGIPTNTLHPIEARQNIGVMPQDPFMFAGTLAENIALSRSISSDEIANLVKLTGLEALIKKGGVGDTLQIGENGDNLSTGQKHLVALARALVNNPKILILDEPTTGLDIGLENSVIEKLSPIVEDKTLILITHRFSALKLVDRVLVVNDGKVVADGPTNVILAKLQGGKSE